MSMFVFTESLPEKNRAVPPAAPADPIASGTSWYLGAKVWLDYAIALTLLILTGPLVFVSILLVKLTSRGPAIYSQTRLGRNGQPYIIYKLRTMTHNCESLTGAQWSQPGDSRVTGLGHWLRRTHIDELPQLWNVLRGDMSLIGPRPERPEFVPQLEQAIPHYRRRLNIHPGITGIAQVQLPSDSDLDSVRIKLAYDLHYVKHVSFFFDMRIYWATVCKMIGIPCLAIRTLFAFPTRDTIEAEYNAMLAP